MARYILDKLVDDPAAPESVYGFHAQQATEKLLKAALAHAGVDCPFTHRLVELIDLATELGVAAPPWTGGLGFVLPRSRGARSGSGFVVAFRPPGHGAAGASRPSPGPWSGRGLPAIPGPWSGRGLPAIPGRQMPTRPWALQGKTMPPVQDPLPCLPVWIEHDRA